SRFVQYVELDLSRFKGMVPVELFGRTEFPVITERPYLLSLGPHLFAWFSIQPPRQAPQIVEFANREVSMIETDAGWESFMRGEGWEKLGRVMPEFLPRCRWFRGKARSIKAARVIDSFALHEEHAAAHILLVNVEYSSSEPETYVVPLALATDGAA